MSLRVGPFVASLARAVSDDPICYECRLRGCENFSFYDQGCIYRLLKQHPDWKAKVGVLQAVQTNKPPAATAAAGESGESDTTDTLVYHDFGGRKRDGNAALRRYLGLPRTEVVRR